jgi:oligopeptide transport system ATP-binding protein
VDIKPGCRFAARCPYDMNVCRHQTPPLKPLVGDENRLVACHLY